MFKLYINMGVPKLIDASENEQDIIDTMGWYIKDNPETRFIVRELNEKEGDWSRSIHNILDYALYVEEYNTKLKNMSCVELKSNIVKDVKVKRKGLKK